MTSMKTIAIYRDTLLSGSETFIREQAESLHNFRSLYVGLRRRDGLSLPDEGRVLILCREGTIGKFQRASFKLRGCTVKQRAILAAEKPELIHAHFGPDACEAISLSKTLGLPLIASFHGYDMTQSDDSLPRLYRRRRDRLKTVGARFICISNFIRNRAIAKGFPSEKTIVHYTGVNVDAFRPDDTIPRVPTVLFVGRLVRNKGCEHLIRAMKAVQDALPHTKLLIIGDGPLRDQLERQASELLRNFEFLGAQPPSVVKYWMNRAMVFSVPSVTLPCGQSEGLGMVFAEAHAMRIPVVSFLTGGIPEVVINEKTGFLLPEGDIGGLTSRLLMLLQDQRLCNEFGAAGRRRVAEVMNIKIQAAALEDIYEHTLEEWRVGKTSKKAQVTTRW